MAKHNKVTDADLPRLLAVLENGDAKGKEETLRLLCPCRNPVYEGKVWEAMIRAADTSEEEQVQDRADHAIETLLERLIERPLADGDVLATANTLIYMGKLRDGSKLLRGLHVAKHRGSACSDELVRYAIDDHGLRIE